MLAEIPDALLPLEASDEDILYVADAQLNVVFVNAAWRSFAGLNDGKTVLGAGWNSHLLANFSGSKRLHWQAIYEALLKGLLQEHEEDFICPSPVLRRNYRLRIRRHSDEAGNTIYLSHHVVLMNREGATSVLGERLRALDADTALTVEAYKALIHCRPIRSSRVTTAQYIAPLQEVGGDLLWHRDWRDHGTDLVIADVMGHGLDAARLAAKIVMLLEAHTDGALSVTENVAKLNQELFNLAQQTNAAMQGPLFATGLYLRVDPRLQSITFCSFGHDGPIFSKSGYIELQPGLPEGVVSNEVAGSWTELNLRIADHGRRFIIFTDGLTEQFNLTGNMFGKAGIERAFLNAIHWPLQQMVDMIHAEIDRFRGNALVKDDQALLAIEITAS